MVLWFGIVVLQASLPAVASASPQQCPSHQLANTTIEIPFAYPNRPTVYLSIGGETIPLLFDTGTNRSILLDTGPGSLPSSLVFDTDQLYSAQLDGKQPELVQSGFLRYASSDEVMLGNSNPLEVQFRVYRAETDPSRDFHGALSPLPFGNTHIIEILNSESQIHLTPRNLWVPTDHALKLPLKVSKEGIFLKLWIDNQAFWFQFDTGFSGEIAVTPESNLGLESIRVQTMQQSFEGWGDIFELTPWSLADLGISFLYDINYSPGETQGVSESRSSYLLPEQFLRKPTSFEVAGVVGSTFLMKFDYAMDLSAQAIYLSARMEPLGWNPYPILPAYKNQ